jgi:dipeptidyl aminopeptidase/acylaminoacyl peptidase
MLPCAKILMSLCALLSTPSSTSAVAIPNAGGDSCAVRIREATADDVLLRERDPLLGAPENANNAPGPGSLRAVVRSDLLHHAFVFIVDTAADTSRRLGPGSMPRFSPDGRWIACSRWLSRKRPYNLTLIDARTGASRVIERVLYVEDYAWSPDSKRLAFTSMKWDSSNHWDIGWVDVSSGAVHVLATDTDPYVEYEECEWGPDSRRFVANRQREYEHDDTVYAHDLWLFDIDGQPCRLTHTPRREEDFPGWIDGRHIRYESFDGDDETGDRRRHVIELDRAPRADN